MQPYRELYTKSLFRQGQLLVFRNILQTKTDRDPKALLRKGVPHFVLSSESHRSWGTATLIARFLNREEGIFPLFVWLCKRKESGSALWY